MTLILITKYPDSLETMKRQSGSRFYETFRPIVDTRDKTAILSR